MRIAAFVVHPTYVTEVSDGVEQAFVTLWCRLADGKSALVKKPFEPYFFIPSNHLDKAKQLLGEVQAVITKEKFQNLSRKSVARVTVKLPSDVVKLREIFEKEDILCYEADIRFAYRAMMDWGIKSVFLIDGPSRPPKENEGVDVVFEDPIIAEVQEVNPPSLSTLSFDIESDKETWDLYCISCYGKTCTGEVRSVKLIISDKPVANARYFSDEAGLLKAFVDVVQEWDPDIITGWNVIDFDLRQLLDRAKKAGVKFVLGRNGGEMRLRIESSFFRDSTAYITGRVVLDGIAQLKGSFVKLPNYKLATAARHFTNEQKIIETRGKEKYEEITRLFKEDKDALLSYNMQDAKLVIDILEKSGALPLTIKRSLLTGMPLDRVNASIASLDALYLRELRKRGFVAPSVTKRSRDREGMGGFVMNPKAGIYDYVIVCDFKSLYPSLMRTFNIDPLMYVDEDRAKDYEEKDLITSPNGAHFLREQGILPAILQTFWAERENARKAKDELSRFAFKIHMNSLYGVLASPNCRFFIRQMGNAITSFAQFFIKKTAEIIQSLGYEVIYGDTDSTFINLSCDTYEEAQRIGKHIEKEMNTFLKSYIKKEYRLESFLELEFEKTFIRFVMPKVRGADVGAKKRYAGLIRKDDGTQEISFTGLEMVRRDWTDLAKEFQHELYKRIFAKEEVADFVAETIRQLHAGLLDKKLIYRKALRKSVDEYTKTTPPHVKAAMKLKGEIESSLIEYVVTTDGPEPVQNVTHTIDYKHYIDKQLKPIADSILVFYQTSFDDLMKGSTQSSLGDY